MLSTLFHLAFAGIVFVFQTFMVGLGVVCLGVWVRGLSCRVLVWLLLLLCVFRLSVLVFFFAVSCCRPVVVAWCVGWWCWWVWSLSGGRPFLHVHVHGRVYFVYAV
jgi:hypothetical protein